MTFNPDQTCMVSKKLKIIKWCYKTFNIYEEVATLNNTFKNFNQQLTKHRQGLTSVLLNQGGSFAQTVPITLNQIVFHLC